MSPFLVHISDVPFSGSTTIAEPNGIVMSPFLVSPFLVPDASLARRPRASRVAAVATRNAGKAERSKE
jgi:hypothetical protein